MKLRLLIAALLCSSILFAQEHPSLLLTPQSVELIKANRGKSATFDASVDELIAAADAAMAEGVKVPIPVDAAGGYTHEQHRSNYMAMYNSGVAYQLTGDERYAQFVIAMLDEYANIYTSLPMHPINTSSVRGKLFWQTLNDSVWLVHTAVAYDCVYDVLTAKQRKKIEQDLFYPVTEFFMNGTPNNHRTFNKMHNHGTWSTAGVGMIGYAMGDQDLVDKALYGSKKDGTSAEGTPAGFVNQIDELFSPDGYFTEGPYYQRYSIWPFMLFSQCIENIQPELNIYKEKDGVLMKAVSTLIQLSYDGKLMMFNDGLDKTFQTQELIIALDIAYSITKDPMLLTIIKDQSKFFVSAAGWAAAEGLINGLETPFVSESMYLSDGAKGDQGGVAIIRNTTDKSETCLVLKATSHGLSHGHYDKLNITLYDNGSEMLTDYGAARFLNIESKSGGRYTTENNTYAHQSIAHNTVVVDETSHFGGVYKESSKYAPTVEYADYSSPEFQVATAVDPNAYADKDVVMRRTVAIVDNGFCSEPFMLDIFKVSAPEAHKYDMAYHYTGHLVLANYDSSRAADMLVPFGTGHGYQHFWKEGEAKTENDNVSFTWVHGDRFYGLTTTVVPEGATIYHLRTGANDPNMNIRTEPAVVIRQEGEPSHIFASTLEMHGTYDLNIEQTLGTAPEIVKIETILDSENYTGVRLTNDKGEQMVAIVNNVALDAETHIVEIDGETYTWSGNYYISK
ncbi:MAG: heparinase II/III family protein [Rikenellaceae bacterium]